MGNSLFLALTIIIMFLPSVIKHLNKQHHFSIKKIYYGDLIKVHRNPVREVPTYQIWDNLSTRIMIMAFSSVQSLSRVRLFAILWTAARQASLSITTSRSLLQLMPIESVMPSSHLILCRPLLLLPPIPPSIRVFSNESTLHMRWPKY